MQDQNSGHKRKLIQRYASNAASEKELQSLFGMINSNENEIDALLEEEMDKEIAAMDPDKKLGRPKRFVIWYKYVAASLILVTLSAVTSYLLSNRHKKESLSRTIKNIEPGGNVAYLTLGNGKRVILTELINGTIVKEPGVEITKTSNGQLVYKLSAVDNEARTNVYNTIETPRGGQYQVLLPDGTKVWLNAASSLKYPTSFTALQERVVELKGEAYFEVYADKKKPFIVHSAKQEVKVLGTHFNINAYPDEPLVKTTLMEGAVSVTTAAFKQLLKPGQEAILTASGITVKDVETDEAVAWKNGQLIFSSESITTIMRMISRWYDVDVEYQGNVYAMRFTGTISRYANVSDVLQMLEMTNKIKFSIEGRKIKVTANVNEYKN
ncbi:FecR family protein [Pedobacter heparinus]|uniref:FecR family protein n=1 Tax=Pedobacter heparinus TaxID=984 RepID=UPI00292F3C1C|nr:FecR domain-containing protein [Pedobacter heparinus]